MHEFDPHDEGSLQEAKEQDTEARRQEHEREVADLQWLMGDAKGRRFMWRLLSVTGLFRNPFVANATDTTSFRCGEMNVGQRFLSSVHEHCPDRYQQMVREQKTDAARSKRRS
jgi:hypothetical protein